MGKFVKLNENGSGKLTQTYVNTDTIKYIIVNGLAVNIMYGKDDFIRIDFENFEQVKEALCRLMGN